MREQPKDRERLEHILDAVDTILGRCEGMTREGLTADKVLFGGIVYHTMIIGEAAYEATPRASDSLSCRDRLGRVGEQCRCG